MGRSPVQALLSVTLKTTVLVGLWLFLAPSDPRQLLLTSIFTGPALVFMLAVAFASSFEDVAWREEPAEEPESRGQPPMTLGHAT